ncbi:TetR/AcrR family transcriptional regulator [Microbacterium aurum]
MGLREKKAARTRQHIVDVAAGLFLANGYDGTTIEQIAEAAEVGTSTLYRYFTSKDLILLDQFTEIRELGGMLRARPADEPIGVALTAVLRDAVGAIRADARMAAIRKVIDESPVPRARTWDIVTQAQDELGSAIGERLGEDARSIRVILAASTALEIYGLVGEAAFTGESDAEREARLREILETLNTSAAIVPAPLS